jgi:hypothetical protein
MMFQTFFLIPIVSIRMEDEQRGHVVDHNLMRHLNVDQSTFDGLVAEDFLADGDLLFNSPQKSQRRYARSVESGNRADVEQIRREVPSAEMKVEMRLMLFDFLESSRVEEEKLVSNLTSKLLHEISNNWLY